MFGVERIQMAVSSARVRFERLFRTACLQRRSAIIGMVHVQALPGKCNSFLYSCISAHAHFALKVHQEAMLEWVN